MLPCTVRWQATEDDGLPHERSVENSKLEIAQKSRLRHARPINNRPQVANLPYNHRTGT